MILVTTQVTTWWQSRGDLLGAAWVALVVRDFSEPPTSASPPLIGQLSCLAVEEGAFNATPAPLRRKAHQALASHNATLTTYRPPDNRKPECVELWVEPGFSTPFLGRVVVGFTTPPSDSAGLTVHLAPLFGRWLYLNRQPLWL
jgi:hypothetical protein